MFEAIGTLGRLPTTDPQRRVARLVATEVDDIRVTLSRSRPTTASRASRAR
jgi:hypothetical protein